MPVHQGLDTGQQEAVVLELGEVEGVVLDATGSPVAGAWVTTDPRGYAVQTAEDGSYLVQLLPPDDYSLVVAAEGWQVLTTASVAVEAGELTTLDATLEQPEQRGGRVRVEVLGPDGAPLASAVVTATGDSTVSGSTDADGQVELLGVTGDAVTLQVEDADGAFWGRSLLAPLPISDAGGLQWSTQLSGRPSADAEPIGSDACSYCHTEAHETHLATMHALAMAGADELGDALLARFEEGESVDLGGATASLSLDLDDNPQITLVDADGTVKVYAVAGTIGAPEGAAVPWTDLGDQGYPLPLGWIAEDAARGDYPGAAAGLVPYQLERWFDEGGRFVLDGDAPAPASSAEASCLPCHSTGWTLELRDDGGVTMDATSGSGRWNDPYVGCEQCHGNGSEHLSAPDSERLQVITQPELLDTDRANELCGQCHSRTQGLGTGLPYALSDEHGWFRPGATLAEYAAATPELWPNGTAAAKNSQHDELLLSPHGQDAAWSMGCIDCHDPHGDATDAQGQPIAASLRLDPHDNSLCLSCHLGLSFDGDESLAEGHTAHNYYDPDGPAEGGRCTSCHMPGSSADVAFSEWSGAGDLSSHLFLAIPPQDSLDWFDDLGASTLPVGQYPTHACADCHALTAWLFNGAFEGPTGDPTLRSTHQDFQDAYEELYP